MKDEKFIVGFGEVLFDVFGKKKRLGGAPANFAYHVSQFGHEGMVVSAIGYDRDGNDIISELQSHSLPYHLERVTYPTGTVDADISNPNAPSRTSSGTLPHGPGPSASVPWPNGDVSPASPSDASWTAAPMSA